MERIERILVPVDFSEGSPDLLRFAQSFADSLKSVPMLYVAHAWAEPSPIGSHNGMPFASIPWREVAEQAEQEARRQLSRLLEHCGLAEDPRVTPLLLRGLPAQAIVDLAEQEHYDLMIMGTHGRTGFAHLLLGSVVETALRNAPCPVLVLRIR